jgi:hypothetical protein
MAMRVISQQLQPMLLFQPLALSDDQLGRFGKAGLSGLHLPAHIKRKASDDVCTLAPLLWDDLPGYCTLRCRDDQALYSASTKMPMRQLTLCCQFRVSESVYLRSQLGRIL